ncbi:MAG: efflux RND transporter periplasmic adaptor subunit [Acidobacteriota bacterium]
MDSEEGKQEGEKKEENAGVPVEVSEVLVKDISSFISSTTNIETEFEATVLSETDGKVVDILTEEGTRVSKGELLARLDDGEKLIVLKKAKIRAENEAGNYERAKELFAQNLLSPDEFDKVKFQYALAKSDYEESEYNLNKTKIVAPFDGKITRRHIKLGQNIKAGDQLFTVTNFDPLIAHIYLPEKDALALSVGQQVEISVAWDNERRYPGYIERISPIVDAQTGTVKITIYARNLPEFIKPGSFMTVNIVREVHENALLIPKRSIIKDLQDDYVYVVDENIAKKKKVQLGFEDNGYVEVLSGLVQDHKVVSVGQGGLKDGSKVKIIQG